MPPAPACRERRLRAGARYAGLFHFLQARPHLFGLELPTARGALEYRVVLQRGASGDGAPE